MFFPKHQILAIALTAEHLFVPLNNINLCIFLSADYMRLFQKLTF
jgi:hypothetical protein